MPPRNRRHWSSAELNKNFSSSSMFFKAAYDHLRKARKAAEERNNQLSAQRKKVKLGNWQCVTILILSVISAFYASFCDTQRF